MQVAITCRHGSIRDDVRDYLTRKSEKLLTYFERVTAIQITVDFEKDRVAVEIVVDAEHRRNFVAHDVGENILSTFDRVLSKMQQQIKKYKQKLQDHRRDRPLNEVAAGEPQPAEAEPQPAKAEGQPVEIESPEADSD